MISLGCVLARMGNFPLPAFLGNGAQALVQAFATGSQGDIDLQIDASQLGQPIKPGVPDYSAVDLQIATLQLTHNPPPPQRSQRVAVLFANYYKANHGVLGVMFDRGKPSWWDDPNPAKITTASPREGCAVFLGAVADLRGPGIAFQAQAQYTTVHEMGHLFNLQHADPPTFAANYMATSQPGSAPPPNAFSFLPAHRQHLGHCSTSPFVWPGGVPFDGDSGDLPATGGARAGKSAGEVFGLEMAVRVSQAEFWYFEPVELEIELRVAPGVERRFVVPDTVDPGYDTFVIWLETPTGERRRYRSPRRYCSVPGRLTITPSRPFQRDVSIFADADGFTFRRPGLWRIWAEFEWRAGRKLVAAPVEVNVLPGLETEAYGRTVERLGSATSASLLYHRLIRPNFSDARIALSDQAEDAGSIVLVGGVQFALGRALSERAQLEGDTQMARSAEELLLRARDCANLGEHRRRLADRQLGLAAAPRRHRRRRCEIPVAPAVADGPDGEPETPVS